MGTYGTATGTVIGINPTTGQPVFLHLVAGEAALTLSGGDMSLTGTLEISANGEITWAAGSGIADASQFLLEDLEADNHFRWRIGGSIGTSATDDLSFDGVDDIRYSETLLTWKAANTELDANGNLIATNATLSGTITASAGDVGGWTINSTYLAKDTGTDATSAGLAPTDYPFYAGATYANRASAPFRVEPDGTTWLGYVDANNYMKVRNSLATSENVVISSNGSDETTLQVNSGGWYGIEVILNATVPGTLSNDPIGVRVYVTDDNTAGTPYVRGIQADAYSSYNDAANVVGLWARSSGKSSDSYGIYGEIADKTAGGYAVGAAGPVRVIDSFIELDEMTEPSAPGSNVGRLYMKDNGSGKSQLCVRFATGAVQVLATEP